MTNASEPIWITGNASVVTATPQTSNYLDTIMDSSVGQMLVGGVVLLFIGAVLMKKYGLKLPEGLFNQRKRRIKDIVQEYKSYLRQHGIKTNQKLFYGAVKIGKIKRIAEIPYSISLTHITNKDGKRKWVKKKIEGSYMLFDIKRKITDNINVGLFTHVYLIDKARFKDESFQSDIIRIESSSPLDKHMGIWIVKGETEVRQIQESSWKLNYEMLQSGLPNFAEKIATINPRTANESAVLNKEAEIEEKKRRKRQHDV